MNMAYNRTLEPAGFQFAISGQPGEDNAAVGLFILETDGTVITLALTPDLAQQVGRMLCANSDYLAQRPPREWD